MDQSIAKYNSEDCKAIRLKSLEYNDKVGERMAIGLASGLLLGPFGLPFAAAADANQDRERRAWNREIHMRCSDKPLPENLKPDAEPAQSGTPNAMQQ